jgi:hypothetical protein
MLDCFCGISSCGCARGEVLGVSKYAISQVFGQT